MLLRIMVYNLSSFYNYYDTIALLEAYDLRQIQNEVCILTSHT